MIVRYQLCWLYRWYALHVSHHSSPSRTILNLVPQVWQFPRPPDAFRGCTKSLLEPISMDELLWPDKPFEKQTAGVFVQIGFRSQRKWLQKLIETEQWKNGFSGLFVHPLVLLPYLARRIRCATAWEAEFPTNSRITAMRYWSPLMP